MAKCLTRMENNRSGNLSATRDSEQSDKGHTAVAMPVDEMPQIPTSAASSQAGSEASPMEGYQPQGTAWDPDRSDICELLLTARPAQIRSIYYGSNACYLVLLEHPTAGQSFAVYKPARGEYPLWDFPAGSLYKREIATYRIDRSLGWGLVPATVAAQGRFGIGSLQTFIEEADESAIAVTQLRKMALLDWIVNNADRKPDHLLIGHHGRLWGIDHGLTFHAQPKLRTILWHFAGLPFEDAERAALERLEADFSSGACSDVTELLTPPETRALRRRVAALVQSEAFPDPQYKAIPYRW